MADFRKLLYAIVLVAVLGHAQQPAPDTYISTGMVTNFQVPYHPAPYFAAGTLVTSPGSTVPTYAGFRYELYRDAAGRPAYAGLATMKNLYYRKGRFFMFGDIALGGSGSFSDISSAIQVGNGFGVMLGKADSSRTPHWEIVFEPQARRIPALANGVQPALLFGGMYTFNRPR